MMQSVFCKDSESRAANANLFANLSEAHPVFCKDNNYRANTSPGWLLIVVSPRFPLENRVKTHPRSPLPEGVPYEMRRVAAERWKNVYLYNRIRLDESRCLESTNDGRLHFA